MEHYPKRDEAKSMLKRLANIIPHKVGFYICSERFGDSLWFFVKTSSPQCKILYPNFPLSTVGNFFFCHKSTIVGNFLRFILHCEEFFNFPTMSSPQRKNSPQCRKKTYELPHNVTHTNPQESARICKN